MKSLKFYALIIAAAGFLASCKPDDIETPEPPVGEEVIEGEITEDRTFTADVDYVLQGNVYVTDGATLTIEPGTVIKGDRDTKGALIITQGSKIMAEGTASQPIVMTSSAPTGYRNRGDWGGLVILGNAETNLGPDQDIEGISAGDDTKFGGNDNADNSGSLKYVRIEFAGIALSPDNELNSLTMGGVGSGTNIDHIMVSYAGDDAYEWFGGTVNASHLIAYNTLDDDFDTDRGFTGTINYGVVVRHPGNADVSGGNAFESDNNKNTPDLTPVTAPVFNHITIAGPLVARDGDYSANFLYGGHLRRGSSITIQNSVIAGYNVNEVFNFDNAGPNATLDNVIIGLNPDEGTTDYVTGNVPASADYTEESDQANIFSHSSWGDYSAMYDALINTPTASSVRDVLQVEGSYSSAGAFGTGGNWNWGDAWVEFNPVEADY